MFKFRRSNKPHSEFRWAVKMAWLPVKLTDSAAGFTAFDRWVWLDYVERRRDQYSHEWMYR